MTSKKSVPEYTECILASGAMDIVNKKNLIGFCHYSKHRGFITRSVLNTHNCDGHLNTYLMQVVVIRNSLRQINLKFKTGLCRR